MKKILLFTAITIICSLISCSTDDEDFAARKATKVFTATIDQSVTRTTINTSNGKVTWNENDEITITDKDNKSAVYVCTEITDGIATFEPKTIGEEVGSGPYTATYGPFPFTEQTYRSTQGQLPMTAESSSTNLNFSVTCGLLGVKLQAANEGIKSIAVSNGTDTYTLTCIEPVGIESAQTFYIALPAGDYTSFIFTDHQGKSCPKTLKNGKTFSIKANQILSIQFTELNHWYVDLGLPSGTCWATFNVGANSPEEYGDYFAWGETEPKSTYDWSTYKLCNGSYDTLTKYTGYSDSELELSDDVAYVKWGRNWRMPSLTQMCELMEDGYTTTKWTTSNGVSGLLVTSKLNGRSIFLPAGGAKSGDKWGATGGRGFYWTRTLKSKENWYARDLNFAQYDVTISNDEDSQRKYGYSVRPVYSN